MNMEGFSVNQQIPRIIDKFAGQEKNNIGPNLTGPNVYRRGHWAGELTMGFSPSVRRRSGRPGRWAVGLALLGRARMGPVRAGARPPPA